jgi:hypothetical protein
MKTVPAGYTRCADGTHARTLTFVASRHGAEDIVSIETLIRDRTGRLLRVERTPNALAQRKRTLSPAPTQRKPAL